MALPEIRELRWANLRRLAELVQFGELTVQLQHGEPIRLTRAIGSIKLDDAREIQQALGAQRPP